MLDRAPQEYDESDVEEEEDEDEYAGEEDLSEEGEDWDEMESRLQKGAKPGCLHVELCLFQCQVDLI